MTPSSTLQLTPRVWPGLALTAVMGLSLVWAILSEGTWDDDCVTRYYNVRNAFRDPTQFIGVWNRPLFVLLYALPLQLGTAAVAAITALITTLTAYLVYRVARRDNLDFPLAAIAFLALQPLVFGLSFSALTEPLAALLVAIAVWSFRERRWNWFTLSGALLPLARLELSVLLVVWAVALSREKRWLSVLMLIVPTLIWNGAGFVLEGDWLWLPHQVLTGEENRYGHLPVAFYPARYVDVVGPVVFYFFALGLLRRAVDRRLDLTLILFVLGFLLYVAFASWLSIGHSAGFLRNLVPLSPLAALLACEGFTVWIRGGSGGRVWAWFIGVVSLALVVVAVRFLSYRVIDENLILVVQSWRKPTIIAFLAVLGLLMALRPIMQRRIVRTGLAVGVVSLTLAWAVTFVPPFQLTDEQRMLKRAGEFFLERQQRFGSVLVNHPWFFYASNIDKNDPRFRRLNHANLETSEPGDLIVIESHYSHRLEGDVEFSYLEGNPEFQILGVDHTPDRKQWCGMVLRK